MSDSSATGEVSPLTFREFFGIIQLKSKSAHFFLEDGEFAFPKVESTHIDPGCKVLVIAPHQDDEILGCGGTICKYRANGAEVKVVYLTDGSLGSLERTGPELAETRKNEARLGLEVIGCSDTTFLEGHDGSLTCSRDMVMKLVKIIEQYEPDKVFVPFFIENQPDHMIAGKIVAHALKKYNGRLECYCYEVWTPLYPNVLVNITDVIEKKLEALGKHESQLRMIDYVEKIKSLNSYRSITAGKSAKYCEAFLKCSCEDYVKMAQSLGVYY